MLRDDAPLITDELRREQRDLIDEIHAAFRPVSRVGGVSWSEAAIIDEYGTEDERMQARARDRESSWTELVDDPHWDPEPGIGGFSFLDAMGVRYYLPAAMVRTVRAVVDEGGIMHPLTIPKQSSALHEWALEKVSLLDDRQRRCVARVLRFMVAAADARSSHLEAAWWREALESHWLTPG